MLSVDITISRQLVPKEDILKGTQVPSGKCCQADARRRFCKIYMRLENRVRPLVMRDFFFEVANRVFLCFQVSLRPVKRNQAGSCWNEFDYSRRHTQTSIPLLDCRRCENFGLGHSWISCLQKKVDRTEPPFWSTCQFSGYPIEKWATPKFSQPRLSRSEKVIWAPLRE